MKYLGGSHSLRLLLVFLIFHLLSSVGQASLLGPAVMSFDGVPDSSGTLLTNSYSENGIMMSLVYNHYDMVGEKVQIDTYPKFGYAVEIDAEIRFELVDGGTFYLRSLELTLLPDGGNWAEYVFRFSDGSTVVPPLVEGPNVLDDEFAHLPAVTYFTYSISQPPDTPETETVQFNTRLDNITLVPEPSYTLLGLGSLALVVARRNR